MKQPSGRTLRRLAVVAALGGVVGCCGCLSAAYAVPLATPTSGRPVEADVCLGLTTYPRVQVGLWWQWVEMSLLHPAKFSPYVGCAPVPWPSIWPARGELAFPP